MSDDLYLTQDMVEWLSQKKSEFLAWLIEHLSQDDVQVEAYHSFDSEIEATMLQPDFHYRYDWCGQKISVFLRHDHLKSSLWFAMISVEITTKEDVVYYPLLFIPTKDKAWLNYWLQGEPEVRQILQ